MSRALILLLLMLTASVEAFVTPLLRTTTTTRLPTRMMPDMPDPAILTFSQTLAFTDQGQNLAGIFFQASLLPYLLFLYFLQFRGNRLNETANFGFQFVLLFVMSTIPSGIVSKSVYGTSLANVDYLHGGAELLLTVANVLIVSSSCVKVKERLL